MTIIELTMKPHEIPVAFETTGIVVRCIGKSKKSSAIVNDIMVMESYDEVLNLLLTLDRCN